MKNTFWYMLGEIIPKFAGIFLLPIFTRYLSTEDYGVLSYTSSIVIFIYIVCSLSLNSYILRNYFEFKTKDEQKKMLGNIFCFMVIFNVLFSIISMILLKWLFILLKINIPFYPYMVIAILSNFLEVLGIVPLVIYRIQEKAVKFISITIGQTILQIIISLILIVWLHHGLLGRYFGILLTNMLFSVIFIWIVKKETIININYKQVKEALKFSMPLIPASISFAILDVSDRAILGKYVSLNDLGIYSVAYTLGFGVNVIINGGYRAFEPLLFRSVNKENFMEIFTTIKNKYMFFIFTVSLVFIMFSQEILKIMASNNFYFAYKLVPIIVLAAITKGIYMIYGVLIMAKKNTKILSYAVITGAVVNISINIVLIPKYGIVLAAISTTIAFLMMTLIVHIISIKKYSLCIAKEIKEYIILIFLGILSYFMFFKFNISFNLYNLVGKFIVFILLFLLLIQIYKINFKNMIGELRNVK